MTDKINPMLAGIDEEQRKRLAAGLMGNAPRGVTSADQNSGMSQYYQIQDPPANIPFKPPTHFDDFLNYLVRSVSFPSQRMEMVGNKEAVVGPSGYGLYLRGRLNPMMKPDILPKR